jgi:membrane protease YdiL (CAAX protease family)
MGFAVVLAATGPWVVLLSQNLQRNAAVPWSVAAMAAYLFVYWSFLRGGFWPRSTSARRRELLRAEPLTEAVWNWSLLALVLGFAAAFVFLVGIYARLTDLPVAAFPISREVPWYVVGSYIAMIAVVAGVAEEAAYRGYMQRELERAYGPVIAIGLTAGVFTLAHWSMALAPFIVLVSLMLGSVAYLARSIRPGIWVHGGYDAMTTTLIWQLGYVRLGRIDLARGVDDTFVVSCALAALLLTGSVWAMAELVSEQRRSGTQ